MTDKLDANSEMIIEKYIATHDRFSLFYYPKACIVLSRKMHIKRFFISFNSMNLNKNVCLLIAILLLLHDMNCFC